MQHAESALDTPPTTDFSELSANDFDTESELVSDRDFSDAEGAPPPALNTEGLTAIVEVGSDASAPPSPALGAATTTAYGPTRMPTFELDDGWSVSGGSDAEAEADGDLSAPEGDLAGSLASLELSDADGDTVPAPLTRRRQTPLRARLLERQRRAASSPSRSPARRALQRCAQRCEAPVRHTGRRSFYDYLFA